MKKILSAIAALTIMAACSTAVFADDGEDLIIVWSPEVGETETAVEVTDVNVGDTTNVADDKNSPSDNPSTGVLLAAVPAALSAAALAVSGIIIKKKNK